MKYLGEGSPRGKEGAVLIGLMKSGVKVRESDVSSLERNTCVPEKITPLTEVEDDLRDKRHLAGWYGDEANPGRNQPTSIGHRDQPQCSQKTEGVKASLESGITNALGRNDCWAKHGEIMKSKSEVKRSHV
ncbi:hypothetical protein V6N13_004645 [Hibiscus sabdariffa]|uniref:Uncharacterized protein n=1 Tax=Hibiscus sabdariffa TaxID=183260 RepID=A0ABR2RZV3_9ROSI